MEGLVDFAPSNDPEGDCGIVLTLQFKTEAEANAVSSAEGVNGSQPLYTGKHVFKNWTSFVEKRGAINPKFDPFKMEANKDSKPDYNIESYQKTLDLLGRSVYIAIDPDTTKEQLDEKISAIKKALGK